MPGSKGMIGADALAVCWSYGGTHGEACIPAHSGGQGQSRGQRWVHPCGPDSDGDEAALTRAKGSTVTAMPVEGLRYTLVARRPARESSSCQGAPAHVSSLLDGVDKIRCVQRRACSMLLARRSPSYAACQ